MKRRTCPRAAEVARKVEHAVVVEAALDHGVDLDGQPRRGCRLDPLEHALDREVHVVHRPEDVVVERVEADGDSTETGVAQRLRLLRQQRRVRRQRQVEPADPGEHRDELLEVAAEQRLAAGQPDLLDAVTHERTRGPLDLLEREQLTPGQEGVVAAEDLLRHAVDAPEVAAIGDRDAQISERPGQCVENGHP